MLGDGRDYLLSRLELHERALLQVCRLGEKFSSLSRSTFLFEVYTLPCKGMCALKVVSFLDKGVKGYRDPNYR